MNAMHGIKKNKCWKRIKLEHTSHSIIFLIYFLHIDVVHLSLMERVGLVGSISLLFWAFICIVPSFLALEALNLTDVPFCRLTSIAIPTVVAFVSTLVVLISMIVMAAVVLVVMVTITVVVAVILPMLVGPRTSTIITMGMLVRRS